MDKQRYKLQVQPWPLCAEACSRIRRQVFIVEQAVPEEEEWDGRDAAAAHFLILDQQAEQAVACARLLSVPAPGGSDSAKVTRMAVLEQHRRQGLGSALLQAMLEEAKRRRYRQVELDAQLQAVMFYQKARFHSVGKPFWDAGIEHIKMIKQLV